MIKVPGTCDPSDRKVPGTFEVPGPGFSTRENSMERMRVRDIMTSPAIVIGPATTVPEAIALMKERHIRHLPVVEDDRLVGMISRGDLREASITASVNAVSYELHFMLSRLTIGKLMSRQGLHRHARRAARPCRRANDRKQDRRSARRGREGQCRRHRDRIRSSAHTGDEAARGGRSDRGVTVRSPKCPALVEPDGRPGAWRLNDV